MRHRWIRVCLRSAGLLALVFCATSRSYAQDVPTPLVFTVGVPDRTAPSTTTSHLSTAVEERGLEMWSGGAADFGVAVAASNSKWTLRSIASMTTVPVSGGFRP